jgi:RNA polymerase sigma-70 factor (ECF subfamily)
MIRTELIRQIQAEMEHLPEKCRIIFELAFFEEMKTPEIASLLSISQHTVRAQKSKAVRLLRSALLKKSALPLVLLWQLDLVLTVFLDAS